MVVDPIYGYPTGKRGRETLDHMNEHHRPLTEWALSQFPRISPDSILDIGCGGGMMISLLAEKFPESRICGVDISEDAVEFTSEKNKDLIASGRCRIEKASVESIPCGGGEFDLVVSCESYFFWPDLVGSIEEICRVTSLGGYIAIISEAYPHPDFDAINEKNSKRYGMKLRSNEFLKALIGSFGYEVEIRTVEEKNWVMLFGRKVTLSSF